MCKGCKLYAILALNDKGMAEGLENLLVVREFVDVFPEELPGFRPERELEFTIDLKPGTEPIARMPYRMSTPELQELKMQLKGVVGPRTYTSKCVTLGCTCYFHTEEGWVVETLH
jgi:hypothetical protein